MDESQLAPETNEQTIIENTTASPQIVLISEGDELETLLGAPVPVAVVPAAAESTPAPTEDPEFDAYMAVIRLLIGGSVEGAAELMERLEKWEAELNAAEGPPEPGEAHNTGDVARFMLVGMALSAGEGARRQVMNLARASDMFWRFAGSATQPLVDNRVTGIVTRPIDRAFDQLVNRGQKRVNDWIELGKAQEPGARRLARKSFQEVVDEFIDHLAENEELAELVQKKSLGLANEAVDEFRSRTVSADAIAENIVRRILRRPPRSELPQPSEAAGLTIVEGVAETPEVTHR